MTFYFYVFIYLFIFGCAVLVLLRLLSSCGNGSCCVVSVHRLLIAVTSFVAERGPQACGLQLLRLPGSRAQA